MFSFYISHHLFNQRLLELDLRFKDNMLAFVFNWIFFRIGLHDD